MSGPSGDVSRIELLRMRAESGQVVGLDQTNYTSKLCESFIRYAGISDSIESHRTSHKLTTCIDLFPRLYPVCNVDMCNGVRENSSLEGWLRGAEQDGAWECGDDMVSDIVVDISHAMLGAHGVADVPGAIIAHIL